MFTVTDLVRIQSETFVSAIEWHAELDSTNDRAVALAASETLVCPHLVLAARQTAGRGRGANSWWSAPGALTFSLVVDAHRLDLPPERWPEVALAAGLAVGEALCKWIPNAAVGLKWPNDVLLDGRKASGILVEAPAARTGRLVIGVGLNVNNAFADAPLEVRDVGVSMKDATGRPYDAAAVLVSVLQGLDSLCALLAANDAAFYARWRSYCVLNGKLVRLGAGVREAVGFCQGIDDDGRLVLATEHGVERHRSGTILRVE